MQANEFVEKFGWNDARVCILNCACPQDRWLMRHGEFISDDAFDDLKRLVESWELVQSYGGLEKAKNTLAKMKATNEFHKNSKVCGFSYTENSVNALEKAIADVESCQPDLPESVKSLGEVS